MFAPGKGFLEIGAGGGDGKSFIRLTELSFQSVRTQQQWGRGGGVPAIVWLVGARWMDGVVCCSAVLVVKVYK